MKAILTYHSLDASGSPISLAPETFRRHLEWLAAAGPEVLSLHELVTSPPERDAVALTFDDGLESVGDVALPLLTGHGLPATVFVVTDHVGRTNAWGGVADSGVPAFPLLGWDQLASAVASGVELGAHTRTHPRLTATTDARLADEVNGSAEEIERRVGVRPYAFCYPYGDLDDRVATAVAGVFELACTTELGLVGEGAGDLVHLPRLDMVYYRDPRRLEAWGTPGFTRYIRFRAVGRRVRSAVLRAGRQGRA